MSGFLIVFVISCLAARSGATECGGVLTEVSGTITSPNYPNKYPNSKTCTWYINPPTGYGDIVITFKDFQLEEKDDCRYDHVMIYKGNRTSTGNAVRKLCGTSLPSSYSSRSTSVVVHFKADASNVFKGFNAEYSSSIVYETPRCTNVSLTSDNATLQTTCTIRHSSAMDSCVFKLKTGTRTKVEVRGYPYITYARHEVTGNQCTMTCPLSQMEQGNYSVHVEMFPGRKAGSTSNTLGLTLPSVRLTRCPASQDNIHTVKDGLIKQGEAASCTCELTEPGFPRGSLMWQAAGPTAGFWVQNLTDTSKQLVFRDLDHYRCVGKTILDGVPRSVEFTPEYAHGPDRAWLSTPAVMPICLEGDETKTIEITCSVNENNSNPPPLFTIKDGENNTLIDRTPGTSEKPFEVKLNLSLSSLGENRVQCKAENAKFGEFQTEADLRINVHEVPVNKPTITIKSIQHGHVILAGDDVTVACAARGWPAEVDNVTLNCWGHSRVTYFGNTAFLMIHSVLEGDDGKECVCKARGTSSCYRGTSVAAMQVEEYGHSNEIAQPTVNDESSDEDKMASASKASNEEDNSFTWRDVTSVAALGLAFIVLVVIIIAVAVVIRRHRQRESKTGRCVRLSEVRTSCQEREARERLQEHRPQLPPPEQPQGNFYTTDLHLAAGPDPQQQQDQRVSFADDDTYELVGNTKGGACAADGDKDDYMNIELK